MQRLHILKSGRSAGGGRCSVVFLKAKWLGVRVRVCALGHPLTEPAYFHLGARVILMGIKQFDHAALLDLPILLDQMAPILTCHSLGGCDAKN